MAVQFTGRFTKTFLDHPADGTHTDGTGLYLSVSKGGKWRSWSFRHRGKRKTIGSAFHIPLEQAQERLQQFKAEMKAGKDPMAPISNAWTFADEADLFYEHKCQQEWKGDAQNLGKSMIKKYIKNTAYAKTPLAKIGVGEIKNILKPTWSGKNATPVIARRAGLMIGQMIDLAQNADPPRYPTDKKNPVDLTKNGQLRKISANNHLAGTDSPCDPSQYQSLSLTCASRFTPTAPTSAPQRKRQKRSVAIPRRSFMLGAGASSKTDTSLRPLTTTGPLLGCIRSRS